MKIRLQRCTPTRLRDLKPGDAFRFPGGTMAYMVVAERRREDGFRSFVNLVDGVLDEVGDGNEVEPLDGAFVEGYNGGEEA